MIKEDTFAMNLDERVKDAEFENELNNSINRITKEFSYQLIDPILDKRNLDWSILAGQVVGAEYR